MSSIFGKINFNKKPVELSELAAMETALNHWGADDKGQWQNGFAGLGQLMLYNTPESLHEKLPLFNNLSGLTITADARIDNRDELFTKLYTGNPDKATIPDSTLILTAYEKYGEACVQHLIGDFAFAIWDEREQKLFCARDHMGVKPFFYYCDENFFAFASEKKGILCLRGVDKTIDEQFFYNQLVVLSLQAVDTTLYKKIRRVPPANTVTISPGKPIPRLNKYWELDATLENKLGSKNEYIEGLLHHFEQAVRCRTRSAYTVGAELSGGMDSSAITGVADVFLKRQGRHLTTFSNTLPAGVTDEELVKSDEREYMDAVIAFNDIKDYVYVTQKIWDDPLDEIDFLLRVNDGLERFNPGWELPSKKAAMERGVRTMLSGFPGDQMITTRAKGYFLDLLDKKKYKEYLLAPKRFESRFHKIRPFIPGSLIYGVLDALDSLGFYSKNVRASAGVFNIPAAFKKQNKNITWHDPVYRDIYNSYRHSQKYTLNQPLVSQRMEGENRFGLYFKLESRFPMADIRLTQFFSAMPNEIKYGGPMSRPSFRAAMKDYLPAEILNRDSKFGSIAPFMSLGKEKAEPMLDKLIAELPDTPLIKKQALLKRHLENKNTVPDLKNNADRIFKSLHPYNLTFRWLGDENNLRLLQDTIRK